MKRLIFHSVWFVTTLIVLLSVLNGEGGESLRQLIGKDGLLNFVTIGPLVGMFAVAIASSVLREIYDENALISVLYWVFFVGGILLLLAGCIVGAFAFCSVFFEGGFLHSSIGTWNLAMLTMGQAYAIVYILFLSAALESDNDRSILFCPIVCLIVSFLYHIIFTAISTVLLGILSILIAVGSVAMLVKLAKSLG